MDVDTSGAKDNKETGNDTSMESLSEELDYL